MKYDCDKRSDYLSSWHKWFAWHPARVEHNDCRWWEWVERKGTQGMDSGGTHWNFKYRVIN